MPANRTRPSTEVNRRPRRGLRQKPGEEGDLGASGSRMFRRYAGRDHPAKGRVLLGETLTPGPDGGPWPAARPSVPV
ncbi:hypothetical protein GCM10009549_01830 [Streptomyces thermoalcalitolerans]|uniref:Uncharacterized protein n=1 Tax=Streptomyces thermoalcalitolerans TaxID=65605 RepID=A0ABN1NBN5_9ACTN